VAYVTGKTSVLQTATKAAQDIVSAEVGAGILKSQAKVDERFAEIRDREFAIMAAQVDADNELFAANDDGKRKSSGGSKGGSKGGGKGGALTVEDARATVLNYGAFKDLTMGQVEALSAEEAGEYGYPKDAPGTKTGLDWLQWAAKNTDPKASFAQKRAALIIEARRAASDA